jgi:queuosine precursor transporter
MTWIVRILPPDPGWPHQAAYELMFGGTPRIVLASLTAFWAGEFMNSYVLAKLKIRTDGRFLWVRTIGSTIVGEGVDTLIFYPVAFLGFWSRSLMIEVMISNYLIKVGWEAAATPLTYKIVRFLKRAENEDYYDRGTNFNPFTLQA